MNDIILTGKVMLLPLLTILQQYYISHYVFYYEN